MRPDTTKTVRLFDPCRWPWQWSHWDCDVGAIGQLDLARWSAVLACSSTEAPLHCSFLPASALMYRSDGQSASNKIRALLTEPVFAYAAIWGSGGPIGSGGNSKGSGRAGRDRDPAAFWLCWRRARLLRPGRGSDVLTTLASAGPIDVALTRATERVPLPSSLPGAVLTS